MVCRDRKGSVCSPVAAVWMCDSSMRCKFSAPHWRAQHFGVASDMEIKPHFGPPRASLSAEPGEERSHRPQWRPSLATFAALGWRMGVPYRWGCFHLRIFPPLLAHVSPHNGADGALSANNVWCHASKLYSVQCFLTDKCSLSSNEKKNERIPWTGLQSV